MVGVGVWLRRESGYVCFHFATLFCDVGACPWVILYAYVGGMPAGRLCDRVVLWVEGSVGAG